MGAEVFKKLSECRTCLNAGHSGQMIGFIKLEGEVKPDGKPVWDLYNENMTKHVHKTAAAKQKVAIPDMVKPDYTTEDATPRTNQQVMIMERIVNASEEINRMLRQQYGR